MTEFNKGGHVSFGRMVRVHSGTKIKVRNGAKLKIGSNVKLHYNSSLLAMIRLILARTRSLDRRYFYMIMTMTTEQVYLLTAIGKHFVLRLSRLARTAGSEPKLLSLEEHKLVITPP